MLPCTAAAHCARELCCEGVNTSLLGALRAVLARSAHKLVCHGAVEALPELLRQGERGFASGICGPHRHALVANSNLRSASQE